MKQKILTELQKSDFPNLEFLFHSDTLEHALELMEELLNQEKRAFQKLLQTPQAEISFDSFEDDSPLDYYWSLLHHYKWVNNTDQIPSSN